MPREGYPELINYVSTMVGVSHHRTWKILKEYSTVLKDAIKRGDSIEVEGLIKISFTTHRGYIYENRIFTLEDQVKAICSNLDMLELDVRNIIVTYFKRMRTKIYEGYQVNIKGVGYIIPREEEDGVSCSPRVSPVLKKPEVADFIITTDYGEFLLCELTSDDLRFKIEISPDLELPYELATDNQKKKLSLKEVNI